MDPLVSFVVPCYKLAHLLPQCVNSILGQDYKDFELLIMDNCSPDDTPQVAQSFNDPRVRHIRNESNLGNIRNYNKGISLARGKYVWLVSADDLLRTSHALGRFVDVMERNPSVGYVFCRAVELHEGQETGIGEWADCGDEDRIWNDRSFFVRLLEDNCIVASSVFVRKECYDKVGLFRPDLPFAADWYMWGMLAMHYDVAYLSEPMVCCRFHEQSLTSLYSQDYVRICISDELTVVCLLAFQAKLANIRSLRERSEAAFVRRALYRLRAELEGWTPCMSAAEFEDIFHTRIAGVDGAKELRASVYAGLTEAVANTLYRDIPPIAVADELIVLWWMGHQAKLADVASLHAICEAVFLHRAVGLLRASIDGAAPNMTVIDFEELLQNRIRDINHIKWIRRTVYTTLADQQYCMGQYRKAAESYWLGLTASPWCVKTWAKYLLLQTGGVGVQIRRLANLG